MSNLFIKLSLISVLFFTLILGCDDDDNNENSICGNGIVEANEECDCGSGAATLSSSCNDINGAASSNCSTTCFDKAVGPVCGNGIVETDEECDCGSDATSLSSICNDINGAGTCSATCFINVTNDCTPMVWEGDVNVGEGQTDIADLEGYTTINGSLSSSGAITSVEALHCLKEVNGSFNISFQTGLVSLDGLENLTYVSNNLGIYHCDLITNLDGLSGLMDVDGDLDISFNFVLPQCEVDSLVARLVANGFSGTQTIMLNEGTGTCE
jgi:hypothetical protein